MDYQTNLKILEKIKQLPDNRGLLARIFCGRVYTEEELRRVTLAVSSKSLKELIEENKNQFVIEDTNNPKFEDWEVFDYLSELKRKRVPKQFILVKSEKGYYLDITFAYSPKAKKGLQNGDGYEYKEVPGLLIGMTMQCGLGSEGGVDHGGLDPLGYGRCEDEFPSYGSSSNDMLI